MPGARFPPNKLNETPVILVTSLSPRERPHLSVRQRRIAQFCNVEADRKRRKRCRSRCKRTVNRVVSADTPFPLRANPYVVMEQNKNETRPQDDVKVLFPARDILYSDSEVAILSSRSTWRVPNDPPPSIRSTGSSVSLDIPPRPCSRIGPNDGVVVGDRYLNKPPGGFASRDEVFGIDNKPYRQVWHNIWGHQVAEPVNAPLQQVTSDVKGSPSVEEKQRRRVLFSGWAYRSKFMNRPWGRPVHQRTPSAGARSAQRKLSAMRDEGDSESWMERVPKMRRCEPPRRKQGVPRVVVTTASRPMTAISTEKLEVPPSVHPRSAPADSTPATSENRTARLSTVKPLSRPRFSVPIKASRVPMDVYYKEMSCPKPHYSRKDVSAPVKCRGLHRGAEMPFQDLSQDTVFFRDVGFNLPERSHVATLRSGRRMFNRPAVEASDSNSYPTAFQADDQCAPTAKTLLKTDSSIAVSKSRIALRPPYTERSMERGSTKNLSSVNVSALSHLYGHPVASRETSVKSSPRCNYSTEADGSIHPGPRFPLPALYENDLPVPSHYLHDSHALSSQTTQTYHFSRNAPDVLISPPPNPRHTLRLPGGALEIEPSPVAVCNSHCIPTINFIPRYFGFRSHEATIEDDHIVREPFLHPNMTPRTFMPSVDFSRTGSPPRPYPDIFPYVRATSFENLFSSLGGRGPYPTNFQQAGVQVPFPNEDESALKPVKMLLTFGAQVPSSERFPLSSLVCGYLSSPCVETETPFLDEQEHVKPTTSLNAPPVLNAECTKQEDETKLKADSDAASAIAVQEADETGGNGNINQEKTSHFEDTPVVKEKGDNSSSKTEEKVKSIATENLSPTNETIDRCQPIKAAASLLDCISSENPKMPESSTTLFGLARTRSLRRCTCTHSDTRLSTLTESSSDSKQPVESPLPEVSSLSGPRAGVAPYLPQAEQELRFQLVESKKVEEPREEKNGPETAMKCKRFEILDDPPDFQSRGKSLEVLHGDVSITEMCDDDSSALNDTPSEHYRASDFRSSCSETTTFRVSTGYRYTNGKTSFSESGTTCIDDSRVSSLLQSINSSDVRQRFQSAASYLGARRHIALQCQLADKTPTESASSDGKSNPISPTLGPQQVERKDVCVQVPISCCQSVETERYTTEKGVPEGRAGLTLRLRSTVVDVPPVVKATETVGISTEGLTNEEASQATEDCETKLSCDVKVDETPCRTSLDNCADCRRPLVNVSMSPKSLKRLKPFFRSHCDELANICALAAAPLRAENGRSPHQNFRSDLSSNKDKHRCSYDEYLQHDRRKNCRPSKGEAGLHTDASCHYKDEHSEHSRTAGVHKTNPRNAKDYQPRTSSSSRRTADVPDRKHPRTVGREDHTGCRRKVGEHSKVSRPSTGNADHETTKRKPGCATCRKEHSHSSQKKAAVKGKKAGRSTPDIRSSLMHFGLSSIITPAGNFESPNAEPKEPVNTNDSYEELHRRSSRSDEECFEPLNFETSKSYRSGVKDDLYVNYGSTSAVLVCDSLALGQPRKDLSRDPLNNTDSGPIPHVHTSKRMTIASRSTVPAIYLTRAESNDIPSVEDTSIFAPPVQIGFTSVDTTMKDFSVNPNLESVLNGMPLRASNSTVDISAKQPVPSFVDLDFKHLRDANVTFGAKTPKSPEDIAANASCTAKAEQVESGITKEPEEDSSHSADRGVDKQTSSSKLDEKASAENGSFDSEYSPEPSIGCVFTAMRRYMKCHQRPERTSEPAYWNKCPGFRFTGVPANLRDSARKRGYRDCCKCAPSGLDSSPGTTAEVALFRTQRCTKGPMISQKHAIDEEVTDPSNITDKAKVNTKILWHSAFQKSTSRKTADLEDDSMFIRKGSHKTLQDIVSSLKYVKEIYCCDSSKKLEEPVEEPVAIRALPPDMAAAEDLLPSYPRCALAPPESGSCGARRRSSSAPGEVRIRHSRCWSSDHSSLRRYLRDLPRIPADTHHRTARHRISWADNEACEADDRDQDKHNVFYCRWNEKDHEV